MKDEFATLRESRIGFCISAVCNKPFDFRRYVLCLTAYEVVYSSDAKSGLNK